jgi:hypothetical protein
MYSIIVSNKNLRRFPDDEHLLNCLMRSHVLVSYNINKNYILFILCDFHIRLGLDNKQTASLMTLDLGSKQQTYGVDIRDTAVHWINDIEKVKILFLLTTGFSISHLLWKYWNFKK